MAAPSGFTSVVHVAEIFGHALLAFAYAAPSLQRLIDPSSLLVLASVGSILTLTRVFRRSAALQPDAEARMVRLRLAFSALVRGQRERTNLTQSEFAARHGLAASRVMKMEAADRRIAVDDYIALLYSAGVSEGEIADAIGKRPGV